MLPHTLNAAKLMKWLRHFMRIGFQRVPHFLKYLFERFLEDNCLQTASALAYATLISIVPLMAVIFTVFTAFPAFNSLEADIRTFIFANFVPAAGEVVETYLQTFTQHTSRLTAVGIAALIATALLMLRTIDTSLNSIWRAERSRSLIRNFIVYWAVLTLGPLLVGIGIVLTSYFMSLPMFAVVDQSARHYLQIFLPFLSTAAGFTLLYLLIPNRNVPWRAALAGGILAAVLFEIAKRGFAIYVTQADAYQTIYGALATIPIFLLWIYLSWVLILLGAEFTYCLTTFKWQDAYSALHQSDSNFLYAYRLLGHLWKAQCDGRAMSHETIMHLEDWRDESRLLAVLEILLQARWVYRNDEDLWGVARDLEQSRLIDLYRLTSGGLANLPEHTDVWSDNLYTLLAQLNSYNEDLMKLPLKRLYMKPQPAES